MQSSLLGLFCSFMSETEVFQGVKIYFKKLSSAVSDNCSCTRNFWVSKAEMISDGEGSPIIYHLPCQAGFLPSLLKVMLMAKTAAGGFCRIKKVKPAWSHSLKADS